MRRTQKASMAALRKVTPITQHYKENKHMKKPAITQVAIDTTIAERWSGRAYDGSKPIIARANHCFIGSCTLGPLMHGRSAMANVGME
jgi:hypothetical protein